jgi:alkanesulfonate monooxygenase SsuD/methylene tetrahydromethanopterin reductase-like flavin-dependent oxidoreductase (luciferase family)
MKVSIVTGIPWLDPAASQAQAYRDAVEQVRLADTLGFDCAWFTEHHFATHGINPSVLSFAAYVAGVTSRIGIGTAVVVLPLYHPVRLAEEIAQVDILSEGRLQLGIGSGYRFDEFRGLGVVHAESRAMFLESLEVLLKAWRGEPFSHRGKYFDVPEGVSVRPTPLQRPHPPLWAPAISPATIQWVIDAGAHLMTATTFSSISDLLRMRADLDRALARSGRDAREVEIYLHVPLHVTDRPYRGLEAELSETFGGFARAAGMGGTIYQRQPAGATQGVASGSGFDFANYYENHAVMGSPAFCIDKLAQWWQGLRFTHLTGLFNFGLPNRVVLANMERFAAEVMPAVRRFGESGAD